MKLHEILPGKIYQRGAFLKHADRVELLRSRNIGVVVSMYGDADPTMIPGGISYYRCVIPDGRIRHEETLEQVARLAVSAMRIRKCAGLTHCHAGRNRSGLMSALMVRELTGCTGAQAKNLVQQRRPNALANRHFTLYLDSLEAP